MSKAPRSILWWASGMGMLVLLVPAIASALTDASSGVFLSCTDGVVPPVTVNESGATPLAESCDDSVDFGPSGSRSATAAAATTFGSSPTISATADAAVTGIPSGGASADAVPTMQYQLQVIQIATPPVGGVTQVPVTLAASGAVSTSISNALLAGSIGEASVSLLLGADVIALEGASEGSGAFPANSFDSRVAIPNLAINSVYTVRIDADCSADASAHMSVPTVVTAHCQADAMLGSISFDQAAFDLAMGGSTFPLADSFAFDVSSNLIVPVPTSGRVALVLLAMAIALLGLAATARHSRA